MQALTAMGEKHLSHIEIRAIVRISFISFSHWLNRIKSEWTVHTNRHMRMAQCRYKPRDWCSRCYATKPRDLFINKEWFSSVKHSTLAPRLSKDRIKPLRSWKWCWCKDVGNSIGCRDDELVVRTCHGSGRKVQRYAVLSSFANIWIQRTTKSQSAASVNLRSATFRYVF